MRPINAGISNKEGMMYTLCIRYTLDPNRIDGFRIYVENELPVIREAGGRNVAYFLPTDFAGPTNVGYGLVEIETLAEYERYRQALAEDPTHVRNATALAASGAVLSMERSFIRRYGDGH